MCIKLEMPLLEKIKADLSNKVLSGLSDIVVLHINHCMGNSFYFSEVLHEMFAACVFIGAPYSVQEVSRDCSFPYYYGKNISGCYELYEGEKLFEKKHTDFMEATGRLIERAFKKEILPRLSAGQRLLIIEDGGYHFNVFEKLGKEYPFITGRIIGYVEQTSSGTRRAFEFARAKGYPYPFASISRSDIKMYVESAFIGHRVVEELAHFLYTQNDFLDYHSIILLGYGIIGREVGRSLTNKNCDIAVCDTDERIRRLAEDDGYSAVEKIDISMLAENSIVIGSTGTDAFGIEGVYSFLNSKYTRISLASASSQDTEFKSVIELVNGEREVPGLVLTEIHELGYSNIYHFKYNGRDKSICIFAKGLPVNFYREESISLTYSVIDMIFAELLIMGLYFCINENVDNRLHILGDAGLKHILTEEELFKSWLEVYRLSRGSLRDNIENGHPFGSMLRETMIKSVFS